MPFSAFARVFRLLGPVGTLRLFFRKVERSRRYRTMLKSVPTQKGGAQLKEGASSLNITALEHDREQILKLADAILRDENYFFTFPYRTRIERAWEFDPIEQKHWPRRHYTERFLHAEDTPKDVKNVFEINRFKDLATLGQAALFTKEKRYADEAERRIISWIEENLFAKSVNWSSGLEISIRLIAWTTTLILLRRADFTIALNAAIARAIYEQVCYLAADMGTDKVVPTNHLIGEAAGVFIVASLFEFAEAERFRNWAQKILEVEIIRQTFADGVTREASSWYHQFVMHFFDLADRIADAQRVPFSQSYKTRLFQMQSFAHSMTLNGEIVRYGDSDDGWALWMAGNLDKWKDFVFEKPSVAIEKQKYYPQSEVITAHVRKSFLFLRAGAFGMGGEGFSSHAHDDFLSPILYLDGESILTDPGTFIYNNDPSHRIWYRKASSHNGIILSDTSGLFSTGAISKPDFGWKTIRRNARILSTTFEKTFTSVRAQYGEWPQHEREIEVQPSSATITDRFSESNTAACEWHFHLAPIWKLHEQTEHTLQFQNNSNHVLTISISGEFDTVALESYDYSPSYRVAEPALVLHLASSQPHGNYMLAISISHA